MTEGIDATKRYVPESAQKAIRLLQENGHLCFINTGRSRAEIHSNITSLGFDGFVCGCGTYVSYHDEVLFSKEIPMELADKVYEDLHNYQLDWLLEGQHDIYFSTLPYTTHIGDFHREYQERFPEAFANMPPEARGLHYDKYCICTRPDSDLDGFIKKYETEFTFIDRGHGFYEVVPSGCSKASGMEFLMDYFQIPLEDTVAIGDSTNDMPMLEFAGLSIAMKASDAVVLEAVDYVTDTVENDGIYKAMQHFHFI